MKSAESIRRITPQRRILLDILDRSNWHPSAEEVCLAARKTVPTISLGTVYRNLDMLIEKGLIAKFEDADGLRRYDGNPSPHYHVQCLVCGAICDVPDEAVVWDADPRLNMPDFTVTGCHLLFSGYCSRCRSLNEPPGAGNETSGTNVDLPVEECVCITNENNKENCEHDESRTAKSL